MSPEAPDFTGCQKSGQWLHHYIIIRANPNRFINLRNIMYFSINNGEPYRIKQIFKLENLLDSFHIFHIFVL